VVGLRDSWATPNVSSTTVGLPGGKMPTTGLITTRDIGQAEQFAFSVVHRRPTPCRHVYLRSFKCQGTRDTLTPK
jgi:hypothetical protein